jgi:transcriptional regulator with XRE-family HTH domain
VDEQTQVVRVQRRRSRAEAGQLVAEYAASGLSQVQFCRKQGLSLATLARYRKRRAQDSRAAGNRWVELKQSAARPALGIPASSGLAVAMPSGRRIEIGRGFDAHTLALLLGVLERL